MSIIQDILSGVGIFWSSEKTKINANFNALNTDKAETSAVPANTSDLTNDSDFVADATYVKTDNNFTDVAKAAIDTNTAKRSFPAADETRLADTSGTNTGDQDMSDYATSAAMDAALLGKVDTDGAKVLTDVNFSSADKVLVDTISDRQMKQTGYGLSQNNVSDADKDKIGNLPLDANDSLSKKADLDGSGKVPDDQLPDSVTATGILYYSSLSAFPNPGTIETMYVANDTYKEYFWNGAGYIVVGTWDGNIDAIDLDGGVLYSADLLDESLFLTDAGANGSNKKVKASNIWSYIYSKLIALTDLSSWASVLDEDNMASDSATKLATQQSIKAYVDNVTSLVGAQNKLDATAAPEATDDASDGYSIGSVWINITSDTSYICVDATDNIAIWKSTTDAAAGWSGDITDIDIAGGSEIGEALTMNDLIIIDNEAAGVIRKSPISRLWTYIQSQIALVTDVSSWGFVLDEDDFATDSDTKVATQQSIKAYVDASVSGGGGVQNNFASTTYPSSNSDSSEGYSVGSVWININSDYATVCVDDTVGDAKWTRINNPEVVPWKDTSELWIDSGVLEVDVQSANFFYINITEDITDITFPTGGIAADMHLSCRIKFQQDGSGSHAVAWGSTTIAWPGGTAATISSAANAIDIILFESFDSGTTWQGTVIGQNYS